MNNQKGTVYEIGAGIESKAFALPLNVHHLPLGKGANGGP